MKGQSLIEVLAVLGVITVIVTVLAGVIITSMGNVLFSKNQNLATQYAQEGMEIMRQKRDSDYVTFRNYTGTYCLAKGSSVLGANCTSANIDSIFLRKVEVAQSACAGNAVSNMANITVSVSWQDSKCASTNSFCHTARLTSCLSTVNPVPPL